MPPKAKCCSEFWYMRIRERRNLIYRPPNFEQTLYCILLKFDQKHEAFDILSLSHAYDDTSANYLLEFLQIPGVKIKLSVIYTILYIV